MKRTRISLTRFDVLYSPAVHNRGVILGETPDVGVFMFILAGDITYIGASDEIHTYLHEGYDWDTVGIIDTPNPVAMLKIIQKRYTTKNLHQ